MSAGLLTLVYYALGLIACARFLAFASIEVELIFLKTVDALGSLCLATRTIGGLADGKVCVASSNVDCLLR